MIAWIYLLGLISLLEVVLLLLFHNFNVPDLDGQTVVLLLQMTDTLK